MSLPSKVVERLFERLSATYGTDWISRWAGANMDNVKGIWSHELAAFSEDLGAIAWALENLPPRAPNPVEFRQLCRQAPKAVAPALPMPPLDPANQAKVRKLMQDIVDGAEDHLLWAKQPKSVLAVDYLFSALERTKDLRLAYILEDHRQTQGAGCRNEAARTELMRRLAA